MLHHLISEKQFLERVGAFNDGELDASARIEVLQYLAANPDATQRLIANEEFRVEIRSALCRVVPVLSESLNRRVMEMANAPSQKL